MKLLCHKLIINCNDPLTNQFFSTLRLEFIASYSKGHSMAVVAKGLLNGEDLMKLYGGTRKKKVFLYLAPGICWFVPFFKEISVYLSV